VEGAGTEALAGEDVVETLVQAGICDDQRLVAPLQIFGPEQGVERAAARERAIHPGPLQSVVDAIVQRQGGARVAGQADHEATLVVLRDPRSHASVFGDELRIEARQTRHVVGPLEARQRDDRQSTDGEGCEQERAG
jgi:hypothetical protein